MTDDVILLDDVAVRYRLPTERIPSLKEFAIRAVRGQIGMREFYALKDISLRVPRGSTLGIVGNNGAGKSTLLKVISRVITPTRGRVRLSGRVAPLLELGAGFDYELTGRENILLNGTILGFSAKDLQARQDRIIEFAGLRRFIDAPLRTYSSGMVVRLGFAIATDVQPDILIVDEVLGVGDAEFQTRSRERIESFAGNGSTILFVSHSAETVRQLCQRAIWLDHGEMIAEGAADWVVAQYQAHVRNHQAKELASMNSTVSPSRWGSGEVVVEEVRFLDGNGQSCVVFATGDTMVIEIGYHMHQKTAPLVFGLAFHRQDGVHISGPNSLDAGITLNGTNSKGRVRFVVDDLRLLDGLYQLTVSVVAAQNFAEIYDFHDRLYQFRVTNPSERGVERYGMMTLRGRWLV